MIKTQIHLIDDNIFEKDINVIYDMIELFSCKSFGNRQIEIQLKIVITNSKYIISNIFQGNF